MKKLYLAILTLLIFANANSYAQNYLGYSQSNYAGILGADLQPASIVDNGFKFDLNLFSTNVDIWNNTMAFDTKALQKHNWVYSFKKNTDWMNEDDFYNKYFKKLQDYRDPKAKPTGAYVGAQIDFLNFMFHINRKIAIGFGIKARFIGNADLVSQEFLKLAENGFDFSQLWNKNIDISNMSVNALAWAEYKLNYAQVVMDKNEHFLKVGGALKFNKGIGSGYAYAKDVNVNFSSSDTAAIIKGNVGFGFSDNVQKFIEGNVTEGLFSSKLGFGIDLGVVYEWRPDYEKYKYKYYDETLWRRDKKKYKLSAGISLLDVGGMKFTKADKSRDFSVDAQNFDLNTFDNVQSPADASHVLDSLINASTSWNQSQDAGKSFVAWTPAALSAQVDYNIWNDFYVGASAYINLIGRKVQHAVRVPSQFTITPSYDHKWVGLFLPFSFNSYGGFRMGLGLRLGPLFAGVPDIKTLIPFGKVRGAGFYMGLRLPIPYGKPPKDRDQDGVPDKADDCADVYGIVALKGCPDRDKDGIPDKDDECPDTPGLKQFNGCPDTDGDGIPDKDDDCPTTPGLKEFKGCPDSDGDSIPDKDDACPTTPGLKEFNGCPDTDGDGIPDKDDECPTTPGLKEYNGCPDTDGDSIPDKNDDCPTIPGLKEFNGCPDTDGDGIPDKDDSCPTKPGPKSNDGCPVVSKTIQQLFEKAMNGIQFETGKATIRKTSYGILNNIVSTIKANPNWIIEVQGHTDNVGDSLMNMDLSQRRAEAVMKYLKDKGVTNQMTAVGYGFNKPIADNSTKEGRYKNRRVEFKISYTEEKTVIEKE